MTLKEFKDQFGQLPDSTPIAVCLSNGELDYATSAWGTQEGDTVDTIVISGN
jgi:hypothetical protein